MRYRQCQALEGRPAELRLRRKRGRHGAAAQGLIGFARRADRRRGVQLERRRAVLEGAGTVRPGAHSAVSQPQDGGDRPRALSDHVCEIPRLGGRSYCRPAFHPEGPRRYQSEGHRYRRGLPARGRRNLPAREILVDFRASDAQGAVFREPESAEAAARHQPPRDRRGHHVRPHPRVALLRGRLAAADRETLGNRPVGSVHRRISLQPCRSV